MDTDAVSGAFTFVPTVFELEIPLLELQARSFAIHAAPELVTRIVVIDNTARGMRHRQVARLLAAYGPLAPKVEVIFRERIATRATSLGWTSQQVLKLAVAAMVEDERYVALDAKNVLVAPLKSGYLEAPDGRARVAAYPYRDHSLRPALERAVAYFGLPLEPQLECFPATVTPYVLYTAEVRDLMKEVERREAAPFARAFVDRGLTEFFLYGAWLTARYDNRTDLYAEDQPRSPMVWPGHVSAADVNSAVVELRARDAPFFSVHRKALIRADSTALATIARTWAEADLFASTGEALEYVRRYRRFYARNVWIKRAREAPERFSLRH